MALDPKNRKRPQHGIFGSPPCKNCGLPMHECKNKMGPCSSCGREIAICIEATHQQSIFCKAYTAALVPLGKGLARCPGYALAAMFEETGVPYEIHPTGLPIGSLGGTAIGTAAIGQIVDEPWAPQEAIDIVKVDRPLADRKLALRRFAEYLAKNS